MSNVSGIIKSIQDIMRKDVGVDGDAQRISQLVWMFFLKIFDDREDELELLEDDYKSPLHEHLRWRAWAKDPEGITGDELSDFVNLQLFPTLKNKLGTHGPEGKRALVIRDVFEDAYNYMKSGTLMRQVINKICEIDFNIQKDRHTFGAIYEQILKDLQSAGNAGEFYTPRAVTKFIVNRVAPRLDETVLDPACGTGGFLTCAIEHKREHFVNTSDDEEKPFELPQGWEWSRLQESIDVRDGTHDSPKDAIGPDTYPLVTSKNFYNGTIKFDESRRISAEDHFDISKRSFVERYDILFSMIGGNLGNQVIVNDAGPFSVKNVALFKYYDRELTSPFFIKKFMEHLALDLQSKAAGGAQPFVSLGFLRKLVIAIPPIGEQHRIVAKVDELMALCDTLKARLNDAQTTQIQFADTIVEKAVV